MLMPVSQPTTPPDDQTAAFIARWQGVALTEATELSSSQTFILELCALLGVATPLPTEAADYQFERPITFAHGDGSSSAGRIDCYKRGHFVWESKKFKYLAKGGAAHGTAMLTARAQAEGYARALPATELAAGRPPFVVVADIGHTIELYSDFTRSGATYVPFPDPRSHRIALASRPGQTRGAPATEAALARPAGARPDPPVCRHYPRCSRPVGRPGQVAGAVRPPR